MVANLDTELLKDGGMKSRKFILTLLGLFLITGMSVAGLWFPQSITAIMPSFVAGILGSLSLYFTGNIANKHVAGKIQVQLNQSDQEEEKE